MPSTVSADVPPTCHITFAQILSRHGARDPTASKTASYNATIQQIQKVVRNYTGIYSFLSNYTYTLGADDLTVFGQQELVNSGIKFYNRYEALSKIITPFVRTSGQDRVVESALNWTQGFHLARTADKYSISDNYPYSLVVIPEANGVNNTLNHVLCTSFENGTFSTIGASAQSTWMKTWVPNITRRLNAALVGANLTDAQTINVMDLCPYNTMASPVGAISPFCNLFNVTEWRYYDYYQTLGKYYGYGNGNPLGPTQGVGFTNELIARMTATPVNDRTSTNRTLDSNSTTFPVGGQYVLFADFSHDNDMTGIFAAMGLYNTTTPLSNTTLTTTEDTNGYAAAWTVPFAGHAYFEKMLCEGQTEELVRVLVNDRVIPLQNCGADLLGRCTLSNWVKSLSFARGGGLWNQCFPSATNGTSARK